MPISHLTSPKLPNPFSNKKSDHLKTQQLINRVVRHNKINIFILFTTLFFFTLAGFILLEQKDNDQVLGVEKSNLSPSPSPSTSDLAAAFCRNKGGQVIGTLCKFFDGAKCNIWDYYRTGKCSSSKKYVTTPSIIPTPTVAGPYIYYLSITQKEDGVDPIETKLASYISTALSIPLTNPIQQIAYDTRQGDPFNLSLGGKYSFSYYIILNQPLTIEKKEYSDYATRIAISLQSKELLHQLTDPDYCNIDTDCTIRNNICTYGAFNHFAPFIDRWACNTIVDEFGKNQIFYDESKQCKAKRLYFEPKCINNQCLSQKEASQCL